MSEKKVYGWTRAGWRRYFECEFPKERRKMLPKLYALIDAAFAELETCEWAYDEVHDKWDTECGCAHEFNMGAPGDNHYEFCPFPGCGKKIVEIGEPEPDDDCGLPNIGKKAGLEVAFEMITELRERVDFIERERDEIKRMVREIRDGYGLLTSCFNGRMIVLAKRIGDLETKIQEGE